MDQDGMCGDSEKCSDCRHFPGGTIKIYRQTRHGM